MNIKKKFLIFYFAILTTLFIAVGLFINTNQYNNNFVDFSKNYFKNNLDFATKLANNLNKQEYFSEIESIKQELQKANSKDKLNEINSNINNFVTNLLHENYTLEEYKNYIIETYDLKNPENSLYTFYDENGNFEKIKQDLLSQLEKSEDYKQVDKAKNKFEKYILEKTYTQNIINIKGLLSDIKTVFSIIEGKISLSEKKIFKEKINYLDKLFSQINKKQNINFFEKSLLINEFYNKYEETSSNLFFIENYNKTGETPQVAINSLLDEVKIELLTNSSVIADSDSLLSQADVLEQEIKEIQNPEELIHLNTKVIELSDNIYKRDDINIENNDYIREIGEEKIDYLIKKLNKVLQLGDNKIANDLLKRTENLKQKIKNTQNKNITLIENELNLIEDEAYSSSIFDNLLYGEYIDEIDLILTEKSFIEDNIAVLLKDIKASFLTQTQKNNIIQKVEEVKDVLEKIDIKNKKNVVYIYEISEKLAKINDDFYKILSTNSINK